MGGHEVPPKHRPFGTALQAGDEFRADAAPDRHGWLERSFHRLRLTKVSQRLVHLRNDCRDVARSDAVLAQIRGNDLCDVFFHEIAPSLFRPSAWVSH